MKCIECGQEIPDKSIFCPYCGKKCAVNKTNSTTHTKKWWLFAIIAMCLLLIISIVEGIMLSTENSELHNKIKSSETDLTKMETQITSLDQMLKKTRKSEEDYKEKYNDAKNSSKYFDKMISLLPKTKTSNGIISVNNKIYCVRQEETLTILINWPASGATQYMGLDDYSVADATWGKNNVVITGKKQGVTELFFGSDESCTKNRFSVVIVCY